LKTRFRFLPVLLLLLFPLTPLTSVAVAQHEEEREKLALGVETPPLLALPLSEAPGATTVITAEEISRSAAANIFELLRRVPGVDIRYTPMGGHIGIRTTGASPFSEEVLLLIDGVPYNSPDKGGFPGHPNYSGFFPLDRVERIEIIKGPISVLYGANAFGGVINVVTKKPADAITDRVEGSAYGATVSAGGLDLLERSVRADLIRRRWDVSVEGGAQDSLTPIEANGDADQGRSYVYGALGSGNFRASLLHQESRHGSMPFDGAKTQTAHNSVDILDFHYEKRLSRLALRGSATLNRYRGTTCAECHNSLSLEPDNAITNDVGGVVEVDQRLRAAVRADQTLTSHQDLTFGVEAARDSVDREIVRLPGSPTIRFSNGLFIQHEWRFGSTPLHLITGVRHDEAQGLGSATSPRIALVAEVAPDLVVRGSWTRAYRSPTWNERYIDQRFIPLEIAPNLIVTIDGDPDLDRERVDNAEAGLSWRPVPRLLLKLDLYQNRIESFIERGPGGFVPGTPNEIRQTYQNRADPFTIRGFELTAIASPRAGLTLSGSYAIRRVSLDREDPAAAYAPTTRGTATIAWSPRPRWTFDLAGSYSAGYTVSLPDVFGLRVQPAYELIDAAIRFRPLTREDLLEIALIGRNLTDEQPFETLVGPGIDTSLRGSSYLMTLRVSF